LQAAKQVFPLQEAKRAAVSMRLPVGAPTPTSPPQIEASTLWQFFGKNREKGITIAPDHVDIAVKEYGGYPVLRREALHVVLALTEVLPQITLSRMGLRYINLLSGAGDPFDWA